MNSISQSKANQIIYIYPSIHRCGRVEVCILQIHFFFAHFLSVFVFRMSSNDFWIHKYMAERASDTIITAIIIIIIWICCSQSIVMRYAKCAVCSMQKTPFGEQLTQLTSTQPSVVPLENNVVAIANMNEYVKCECVIQYYIKENRTCYIPFR